MSKSLDVEAKSFVPKKAIKDKQPQPRAAPKTPKGNKAGGNKMRRNQGATGAASRRYSSSQHLQKGDEFDFAGQWDYDGLVDSDGPRRTRRGQVSISHLIDVSFQPVSQSGGGGGAGGGGAGAHRARHHRRERFANATEERMAYLNTTCRFVLNRHASYADLLHDPDRVPPMESVQRIIAQTSPCPICLEDVPEAPRMLECGHVLCYPCLLRLLKSDPVVMPGEKPKKYRQCPLCFDRIRGEKIKPVSFMYGNDKFDTPLPNNDTALKLMFRPTGSIFAAPRDHLHLNPRESIPTAHSDDDVAILGNLFEYSRLSRASDAYLRQEYDREIRLLSESRENSRLLFGDSGEFYSAAIEAINTRADIECEKRDSRSSSAEISFDPSDGPSTPISNWDAEEPDLSVESLTLDSRTEVSGGVAGASQVQDKAPATASHGRDARRKKSVSDYDDTTAYFFYQTGFDSLTKFFLAPLDVKILKRAFGTFSQFPPSLVLQVQNVQYGSSVDPDLRKRVKYLGHLPLYTSIGFLECEWKGIISDDILASFSKELAARRKRKKDKDRKEERESLRYKREEEEQLRHAMMEESSFSFYRSPRLVDRIEEETSFHSADAITTEPEPAQPQSPKPRRDSGTASRPGVPSFASVASGQASGADDDREIQELLAQAKPKKGRKKLVLVSNSHRHGP